MPEGHTVHRLAHVFTSLFAGEPLELTSPQGRFAEGAALLSGRRLRVAEAHGKQMFLGFAGEQVRWLRVHLGLYGAWTFASDGSAAVVHAIGAPRRRFGEGETTPAARDDLTTDADGSWRPPAPRGAVRVRVLGAHAVADLAGPTACEVLTPEEKRAVQARLGPDPLRDDADPELFVAAVRRSRVPVGQLLMEQSVVAGVGNIYRAEVLHRARLDPLTPGRDVPAEVLHALWADLVELLRDGVRTGAIVTTRPEDRGSLPPPVRRRRTRQNADAVPGAVPADEAFYVYHRDGLPCRVCGAPVLVRELAGRTLYWCATCQV